MPEYPKDVLVEIGGLWAGVSKAGRKYWRCSQPNMDSMSRLAEMASKGELKLIAFPVESTKENGPVVRLYFSYPDEDAGQRPVSDSGEGFGDF